MSEAFHLFRGVTHAEHVPGAKRTGLMAVAPLHGVIDVVQAARDLGHAPRGIPKVGQQRVANVAGVAVVIRPGHQQSEAGGKITP